MMDMTASGLYKAIRKGVDTLVMLITSSAARRRFPFAVRAGICCALPVVAGWAAGDVRSGLLATIGSFAALYGSDRPYRNRAIHLAIVAIGLAAAVSLGICVAPYPWFAVAFVAVTAACATLICNVLRVGPPGAYMFALACASGTSMGATADPIKSGLYVLGGGIICWIAHMVGALSDRRGPERSAVIAAAEAVAHFCEASGTDRTDRTRYAASRALDSAWMVLITYQAAKFCSDATLEALRQNTQRLHAIFSQALSMPADRQGVMASMAQEAEHIAQRSKSPLLQPSSEVSYLVLHAPITPMQALRDALVPWSAPILLALRVGIGTLIAGALGLIFALDHAYWGMAAVVVVLNQAYGWPGTSQRAIYRVLGTLTGLLLTWAILAAHPQGLWIALAVGLLQFSIEMWVILQYAVAAIFITANALTIAAGGEGFPGVAHLLSARALDTAVGCGVALLVFLIAVPRSASQQIRMEIVRTIDTARRVLTCLSKHPALTPDALDARRDLQLHAIHLQEIFEADGPALRKRGDIAEQITPIVIATQSLAYRLLNGCWDIESHKHSEEDAATRFADYQLAQYWLAMLQDKMHHGKSTSEKALWPTFLGDEIRALEAALKSL